MWECARYSSRVSELVTCSRIGVRGTEVVEAPGCDTEVDAPPGCAEVLPPAGCVLEVAAVVLEAEEGEGEEGEAG